MEVQKLLRKLILILSVLGFSTACSANTSSLEINNQLEHCVSVAPGGYQLHKNLHLYSLDFSVTQSIGYCGCKSALASVTVYQQGNYLMTQTVKLKASRSINVLLSPDEAAFNLAEYSINISCGNV